MKAQKCRVVMVQDTTMKTPSALACLLLSAIGVAHTSEPPAAAWPRVDQPVVILVNEAPLRFGNGMNGPFNDQLADLQMHRRVLTAEEISASAAHKPLVD